MIPLVDRRRFCLIALGLILLFSLLFFQFFRLQVIEHSKWEKLALRQHQTVLLEPGRRGHFFTTSARKVGEKHEPLTVDIVMYHLHIDPQSIASRYHNAIAASIEKILGLGHDDFLRAQFTKDSRSRRLKMWLTEEDKEALLVWWLPFAKKEGLAKNALFFVRDFKRCYPFGKLFGQVLQTVREDKDPQTHQAIPTGGLELYFNDILSGKEGKRIMSRSQRHLLGDGQLLDMPVDGADIYLTIDPQLQAIVEEELEKGAKRCGAKAAWSVMMDPYTGRILALAQYPFFEPQEYRRFYSDPELIACTRVKAVSDAFEPGSVMKPLTAAILLLADEEAKRQGFQSLYNSDEKTKSDDGSMPGRKKPIRDIGVHHFLDLNMAMQKSSNIYLAKHIDKVIRLLGAEWYRDKLALFGLSVKTGLEIPAESPGFLPRIGAQYPNGALEWSIPTPYSLAIGYNVLASAVQMVRSYAILANGGMAVQPTLIYQIVKTDRDGEERVVYTSPVLPPQRLLPEGIIARVLESMRYTTQPGGTAFRAAIPGYTTVGKTSTSEKIVDGVYVKDKHHSSFIGFAPCVHPRFVLMVVMDEPTFGMHYGGKAAAPVFREIGKKSLKYLGVIPDDPDATSWKKECEALAELYNQWNMQ